LDLRLIQHFSLAFILCEQGHNQFFFENSVRNPKTSGFLDKFEAAIVGSLSLFDHCAQRFMILLEGD
jgi:hypothetical protein